MSHTIVFLNIFVVFLLKTVNFVYLVEKYSKMRIFNILNFIINEAVPPINVFDFYRVFAQYLWEWGNCK